MSADLERAVIHFVADQLGCRAADLRPETTLLHDLGVDGDDGWELMVAFGKRFDVDLRGYVQDQHFGPEGDCLLTPLRIFMYHLIRYRTVIDPERTHFVPITIRNLVEAAEARKWLK